MTFEVRENGHVIGTFDDEDVAKSVAQMQANNGIPGAEFIVYRRPLPQVLEQIAVYTIYYVRS